MFPKHRLDKDWRTCHARRTSPQGRLKMTWQDEWIVAWIGGKRSKEKLRDGPIRPIRSISETTSRDIHKDSIGHCTSNSFWESFEQYAFNIHEHVQKANGGRKSYTSPRTAGLLYRWQKGYLQWNFRSLNSSLKAKVDTLGVIWADRWCIIFIHGSLCILVEQNKFFWSNRSMESILSDVWR